MPPSMAGDVRWLGRRVYRPKTPESIVASSSALGQEVIRVRGSLPDDVHAGRDSIAVDQ
jgi:hypothetical protein